MDLNKVMIIGRLTRDPESRTIPSGTPVTNFSVATSRVWKDDSGTQKEATEFHNIVAWRRLAEICAQYLSKGRQVYIEGHLQTRSWDDPQSGKKQYRTEIVADNMIMLGGRSETGNTAPQFSSQQNTPTQQPQQEPEMATTAPASDEEIRIEDIPF